MDPIEVREDRVATNTGVPPVGGVAPVAPVAPYSAGPAVAPVAPVAAAPVAAAPAASTYTSRVAVYPVGYRAIQLVWLIAGVVDLILLGDFLFRAAGANNTGFAHYIYRLGDYLAAPFNGIFNTSTVNGGTVFRWADVLAIVVYSILAWIVTKLIRISATPRTGVSRV